MAQRTHDAILREILFESADESQTAARSLANGLGGMRENLHQADTGERNMRIS
jgi:hypothetical protein